ncbi:MAG: transposase [Methanobacterium sp.]
MLSPLIPNDKHPKWIIVLKILEIIGSHRSKKIAYKLKIYDIDNFMLAIKIIVLSGLFERDISSIVSEINLNPELQRLLNIDSTINAQKIYKTMFDLNYDSLYRFFSKVFRPESRKRDQKQRTIIIDTTPIVIDLNSWRNKSRIGKKDKEYKWSYYPSIGYFVGFKLILAIDLNDNLVGLEIHKNCPNDSKMLIPFIERLYSSKRIHMGDLIICDKGFTSKKNYKELINRFYLIPIIYPRINTNLDQIIYDLNPPLDAFAHNKYKLAKWIQIVNEFKNLIYKWEDFRLSRLEIEVLFNIAKNTLGLNKIHEYTLPSVEKRVVPIVFLAAELISLADSLNIQKRAIPSW